MNANITVVFVLARLTLFGLLVAWSKKTMRVYKINLLLPATSDCGFCPWCWLKAGRCYMMWCLRDGCCCWGISGCCSRGLLLSYSWGSDVAKRCSQSLSRIKQHLKSIILADSAGFERALVPWCHCCFCGETQRISICEVKINIFSVGNQREPNKRSAHCFISKADVVHGNTGHPSAWLWAAAAPSKVILQICRCAVACRPSGECGASITSLLNAAAWNTSNGGQSYSAEASDHVHSKM